MLNKSDKAARNPRLAPHDSHEQSHSILLHQMLLREKEELLWIAEVMTGSAQVAEQCIAETFGLTQTATYVDQEWMLPWIKRLLVHVTLKKISGEIRQLLLSAGSSIPITLAQVSSRGREIQKLRSIAPSRIVSSCAMLERVCFILFAYLRYPLLDCALLLECPRGWVEPLCERAFAEILDVVPSSGNPLRNSNLFVLPGVMTCQAD